MSEPEPADHTDSDPAAGPPDDQRSRRLLDRRTLLKGGLLAGGALAGGGAALADLISRPAGLSGSARAARARTSTSVKRSGAQDAATARRGGVNSGVRRRPPNILVVMVDQLRSPQWFSASAPALAAMPNLARLRKGAVSFASHYTAANDC